jgi:hypothetical protein
LPWRTNKNGRERRTWVIGEVEYLLMRLKQRLLDVPVGMDIGTLLQSDDGKPPADAPAQARHPPSPNSATAP